jgi:hypothetical protein
MVWVCVLGCAWLTVAFVVAAGCLLVASDRLLLSLVVLGSITSDLSRGQQKNGHPAIRPFWPKNRRFAVLSWHEKSPIAATKGRQMPTLGDNSKGT